MPIPAGSNIEAGDVSIATATVAGQPDAMVPRGAIAFFVAMLLAFGVIWLGMYEILAIRQSGL